MILLIQQHGESLKRLDLSHNTNINDAFIVTIIQSASRLVDLSLSECRKIGGVQLSKLGAKVGTPLEKLVIENMAHIVG